MIIGFDFDKVFINYPPFIPDKLINSLYKQGLLPAKNIGEEKKIFYKFPGTIEKKIRLLSHLPIFRSPIKENVKTLKKIAKSKNHKIFLVSSRYSFLQHKTEQILQKYNLFKSFDGVYLNSQDEQPHLFKNKILSELKIDLYVDDDIDLLHYISQKNKKIKLFWLAPHKSTKIQSENISIISSLSDIEVFIK